jgi:hypothetical protein
MLVLSIIYSNLQTKNLHQLINIIYLINVCKISFLSKIQFIVVSDKNRLKQSAVKSYSHLHLNLKFF